MGDSRIVPARTIQKCLDCSFIDQTTTDFCCRGNFFIKDNATIDPECNLRQPKQNGPETINAGSFVAGAKFILNEIKHKLNHYDNSVLQNSVHEALISMGKG